MEKPYALLSDDHSFAFSAENTAGTRGGTVINPTRYPSAGDRDAIHIADQPGLTPEGTQDDATSEQAETIREAEIRKARMNDLSRIAEIQVFNYRLYFYPVFKSDEYYFDELSVPSLMKEYEAGLDSLYVYDDGVVKGFIKIEGTYIARLFVEPVLQNASIGSQLLEYAVKEHDADHLWVLEKNEKAIRFYERHGFAATGEKKPEDGTEEYLVLFKRKKASPHFVCGTPFSDGTRIL